MGVTKQQGQKLYVIKRVVDIALAVLLAVSAIFAVSTIKKDFTKINHEKSAEDKIVVSDSEGDVPDEKSIYVSEALDNDMVFQGSLIVVNNETEYKWDDEGLKSIIEVRDNSETDCYSVMDNEVKARNVAAVALNTMIKAFNEETGHTDIQVDRAYRSVSEQETIYEGAPDTASKPGFSDYHTGYSIDLNVVDESGNSLDFDGEGDYAWFKENCHKYGFILRSPEGKEELTGLGYRPWHFRYVGKAHAAYITENGLCLEEYIEKLKSYPYDGEHLKIKDADGNNYEIYYFVSDTETALTSVPIPSGYEYEISGNNTDSFIVTVCLDKPVEIELETANSETDAESSAEE